MGTLDTLIAERVMGWHQELYDYAHVGWRGMAWRDADGHWTHEVDNWSPTTNTSDVHEMWRHVTGSGNQYLVTDGALIIGVEVNEQVIYIASTDDVYLALCYAALQLAGIEYANT